MTKICDTCHTDQTGNFNKNKSKKDGLNSICKDCSRKRSKQYYSENRERHLLAIKERHNRIVAEHRSKLKDILIASKCSDCPCSDWRVLEFDHINDDKKGDVTQLIQNGNSWEVILSEINKCEIVCANCHRLRTMTRSNCWRIWSP